LGVYRKCVGEEGPRVGMHTAGMETEKNIFKSDMRGGWQRKSLKSKSYYKKGRTERRKQQRGGRGVQVTREKGDEPAERTKWELANWVEGEVLGIKAVNATAREGRKGKKKGT